MATFLTVFAIAKTFPIFPLKVEEELLFEGANFTGANVMGANVLGGKCPGVTTRGGGKSPGGICPGGTTRGQMSRHHFHDRLYNVCGLDLLLLDLPSTVLN